MSEKEFENGYEPMQYLFGTENRTYTFLELYHGEDPQEYLPEKEVNDSTKSNLLSDLENRGLIHNVSWGDYEPTPVGGIVLNHLHESMKEANDLTKMFELSPFIRQIDNFEEFLDKDEIHHLAGSEIAVQSEESGRNDAKRLYREMVEQSSNIKEVIHRTYIPEDFRSQLVDGDLDSLKAIFGPEMAEEARNKETIKSRWKELHKNGATHLSVPGGIPIDYSVSIFDNEKVGILPTDPDDGPDVYLVTSDENVLNWASRLIQKYENQGKEITPPEE